ncbi:response regulator [Pseudaestuariivita sp.]|uniref:response regulator n=1 Tax=Pseudaestuariivita sp. TaxID=2211669 RepID=UPI004058EFEE
MPDAPIRVFLVDDHPIVEAGLRLGFSLSEDFELVGTALNHDAALERLDDLKPDVIVSDLVIDGDLDLEYLTQYREHAPESRLVAFSSLPEESFAERCRAAGADGYISKSTSPHDLAARIRAILRQDRAPVSVSADLDTPVVVEGVILTPRESQVGRRLAQGQSMGDIAEAFGISKKTAAIHRDNLRTKLHCATSRELIALLARSLSNTS